METPSQLRSLKGITATILRSSIKPDAKGRETTSFIISVRQVSSEQPGVGAEGSKELWRIEKLYPDLCDLDGRIRSEHGKCLRGIKLPEKQLFVKHTPALSEIRRVEVNKYLRALCDQVPRDSTPVLEFLSKDVIPPEAFLGNSYNMSRGVKEGYLVKRGRNFGGWKTRFFILRGPTLEYYEYKDGPQLGTIFLPRCQIATQNKKFDEDTPYHHAFMLLERRGQNTLNLNRHVFCAESDEDRDEWVYCISSALQQPKNIPPHLSSMKHERSPSAPEMHSDRNILNVPSSSDGSVTKEEVSSGANIKRKTSIKDRTFNVIIRRSPNKELLSQSALDEGLDSNKESECASEPSDMSPVLVSTAMDTTRSIAVPGAKKIGFFERLFHNKNDVDRTQFGVTLEQAISTGRIKAGYECPSVVHRCIEYLEFKQAENEEGIYRLSGSSQVVQNLKSKFDKMGDYNMLKSKDNYDVHAVAGTLKLYLRELPSSIFTKQLHLSFLRIVEKKDRTSKVNELGRLVCAIPVSNYTTLRILVSHLIRVIAKSDVNKMTMRNMAIVFAPTLGIPAGVFILLVTEFEYVFFVKDDGTAAPVLLTNEDEDDSEEENVEIKPTTTAVVDKKDEARLGWEISEENAEMLTSRSWAAFRKKSDANLRGAAEATKTEKPGHLRRKSVLQDAFGRNNRNSVLYQQSMPDMVAREVKLALTSTEQLKEIDDLLSIAPEQDPLWTAEAYADTE